MMKQMIFKSGDDVCIVFDDKTCEPRNESVYDAMIEEFRTVANKYNYDINQWGTRDSMARFYHMAMNADGTWKF